MASTPSWKVDFFLLPPDGYAKVSKREAGNFADRTNYLRQNENLYVPKEFFEKKDASGESYDDFLKKEQNSVSDLLIQTIITLKRKHSEKSYSEIEKLPERGYLPITKSTLSKTDGVKDWCVWNIEDKEDARQYVPNDVVRIKRLIISKDNHFFCYKDRAGECFQRLVFHPDAFHTNEFNYHSDIAKVLTKHLSILNDSGRKLYDAYGAQEALKKISSLVTGKSSGRGGNEEPHHKDIIWNGFSYSLTCNAHTKLYDSHTNERVYFCWGIDEISHCSIIIVRVGGHWK